MNLAVGRLFRVVASPLCAWAQFRVCVCVVEGFLASPLRIWLGFLLFGDSGLTGGCRVLASGLGSFPRLFFGTQTLVLASLQALSRNSLPDLSRRCFAGAGASHVGASEASQVGQSEEPA